MFRSKLLAHAAVTLTVVAFAPLPAAAAAPQGMESQRTQQPQQEERRSDNRGLRIGRGDTLGVSEDIVSPERSAEILSLATALAAAQNLPCQVAEAKSRGTLVDSEAELFEVACASGPGYLLAATTPPTTLNCLALAAGAAQARATDPEAEVGAECTIERNLDPIASTQVYAQASGITCQVDEAAWLGKPDPASDRFEIGCAGTSGYWIEAPMTGFEPTRVLSCVEVAAANATCRLTTADEIVATVAALAGTDSRTCQVTNARYAGKSGENGVYEVACSEGSGFMFISNAGGQVIQSWDCVNATHLGGGCRLTDADVISAAANEVEQARLSNAGLSCQYQAHRQIGADNRGRTVLEYQCADKPLGLVAFVGETAAESEGMDCIASELLSVRCSLTTRDTVAEALTRMMTAGGESCTVTDYAVLSPAARASRGEAVELKCADGGGYIAEIPFARDRVGLTRSCAAAREYGEACTL